MNLFDFLNPTVKFIFSLAGLVYGIVCLVSGIKKEKKNFFWSSGIGSYIKNPIFNIIYGIILIILFSLAISWYGADL